MEQVGDSSTQTGVGLNLFLFQLSLQQFDRSSACKPLEPRIERSALITSAKRLVAQRLNVAARTFTKAARVEVRTGALARHDSVVRVERQLNI